ncbi:hypothetical protein OUZ56_015037 [Daphnia magna]|uniref:Carbonic anhydrase n=1 Tax=Daphnia magna TaxID=35525 RepID=A0ABR0ALZ5_9CRUS|nr:hypothetical protein OUZ56_015037 [Daphnia magna]
MNGFSAALFKYLVVLFLCCRLSQVVHSSSIKNTEKIKEIETTKQLVFAKPHDAVHTHENPWYEHQPIFREKDTQSWSYSNTEAWPFLFPTCAGDRQSPVNIETILLKDYSKFYFGNYGGINRMVVTNNGHTVLFSLPLSYSPESVPYITGGGLPDRYNFFQFHFHWGSDSSQGSEHRIDSNSYPAELHLVHYNTKYGSFANATNYDDGLAVLGILITVGKSSRSAFRTVVDQLSKVENDGDETTMEKPISLNELLPSRITSFFRYSGSLTTPNCEQSVVWTVFDNPIVVLEDQLSVFRNLKGKGGLILVNNFRPTQPLERRVITYRSHTGCNVYRNWLLFPPRIKDVYQYCICRLLHLFM